jgi:dephospho-CoA kinase
LGTSRDGRIDREELSRHVVGNPEALKQLEAIVHPLVRAAQARFLADAERSGASVAVLDVPLLFETGRTGRCATALAARTAEKFEALLQKQMPDDEKRRRADFVVDTSQSFDSARA